MKRFVRLLLVPFASLLIGTALVPAVTEVVSAQAAVTTVATAKDDICEGLTATGGNCDKAGADKGISDIIKLAVGILSFIVGIAAVIMMIIGGLKYITSQGDSSNTASAKNTILYALIGLVIVGLAQLIVRFTLNKAKDAAGSVAAGQFNQVLHAIEPVPLSGSK